MVFIGHVIATLTCGAFMLAETLYTCRHCTAVDNDPTSQCPEWYHECDVPYGAYLFGTTGVIVCQV